MEYFVKPTGSDTNTGHILQPFKSIQRGIDQLEKGDILSIFSGMYVEILDIHGKQGTAAKPILIRGIPDAKVFIDGCFKAFRKPSLPSHGINPPPEHAWVLATSRGAKADEYVSVMEVDPLLCRKDGGIRGAFLNLTPSRLPYTRLVNYSNIEDLRADNETFEKIFTFEGEGRDLVPVVGADPDSGLNFWYPRVFMGPGYWLNKSSRKIHIRLAHTHNNIEGLADYRGQTDPRKIALAISGNDKPALTVRGSRFIRLENLSVRFGGTETLEAIKNPNTNIWKPGWL